MNVTIKKLALLEKNFMLKEENDRIQGYSTCSVDQELKERVSSLLNKIRTL